QAEAILVDAGRKASPCSSRGCRESPRIRALVDGPIPGEREAALLGVANRVDVIQVGVHAEQPPASGQGVERRVVVPLGRLTDPSQVKKVGVSGEGKEVG